jgi:hypothetical protein
MQGGNVRVAVAQVDGKWPNLPLAKLAAWHTAQGDAVDWYSPLEGADLVYASQVFTQSEPSPYLPPDTIWGGSGHDLATRLPDDVEAMRPDWSLWPPSAWPMGEVDLGYSTRGCLRRCPFCIVHEKEGGPRVVASFHELWTGRDTLILLDPNVIAGPLMHFRNLCMDATRQGVTLDFSQGLDARLMSEDHAVIIARSRLARRIHMAFDHPRDEAPVRFAVDVLGRHDVPASRLTFYVLVGFDTTPEEDLYRVELLRSLGADPFVMPFDRTDDYQRRFARWVNRKELFKSCTFAEYKPSRSGVAA